MARFGKRSRRAALLLFLTGLISGIRTVREARSSGRLEIDPTQWMTQLAGNIGDVPLRSIVIPGTHDSGTSGITERSPCGVDAPSWLPSLERFGGITRGILQIVARWSRTQNHSIATQLAAGIRYFDLRVQSTGSDFVITHGLISHTVDTILAQVQAFIAKYPREIILLDFNTFYGMDAGAHERLVEKIIRQYRLRLAPRSLGREVTPNRLWANGQQVLAFYGDRDSIAKTPLLWSAVAPKHSDSEGDIYSPWPNRQTATDLIATLSSYLPNRYGKFFVLQCQATPDEQGKTIASGLIPFSRNPDSVSALAEETNPIVLDWVMRLNRDSHLNIVIVDAYERTDLVTMAIRRNVVG